MTCSPGELSWLASAIWALGGTLREFTMMSCILAWPRHPSKCKSGFYFYVMKGLWLPWSFALISTGEVVQGSSCAFWKIMILIYYHCSSRREMILWAAIIWCFSDVSGFEQVVLLSYQQTIQKFKKKFPIEFTTLIEIKCRKFKMTSHVKRECNDLEHYSWELPTL